MGTIHLPAAGVLARMSSMAETIVVRPQHLEESPRQPWYGSEWVWLALAVLSVVPFMLSPLPPLGDLFSHMARYHVAQTYDQSAWLQRYYHFEWALLPNLGQDLLMVPFGRVFGIERGAMILCAMIPPLTILAIRALSIAVHGKVQPLALLALPFTYSFTFLFGFMNFNTGLVVMLWSTVLWYRIQDRPVVLRASVFATLATVCWVCHLAVWALLVVVIGCLELVRALNADEGHRADIKASIVAIGTKVMPVMIAVMLPALLSWYTHVDAPQVGPTTAEPWLRTKIIYLRWLLRDESPLVDGASLLLIAAVPAWLFARRLLRIDAAIGLFGVAMFVLYWLIPTAFNNAYYADIRYLPVIAIAALVACRDTLSAKTRTAIAVGAIALFAGRIALTTHGWIDRGESLQQELVAIDRIPVGARLASTGPSRTCETWQNDGLSHLASFALTRRDAFVTSMWDIPGQHILRPTYLGTMPKPVTAVAYHQCGGVAIGDWLATFPRDKFDFVWLFKVQLPAAAPAWLTPVYRGPQGALYAVRHDGAVSGAPVALGAAPVAIVGVPKRP